MPNRLPDSFHDPTTFFPPTPFLLREPVDGRCKIAASVCVPVRDSTYALHQVVRKRSICIINAAI
ncbi:hypothetical protein PABG_11929 [Paracoccidioides brasiliensis Pb03]|nr:hypothetical protein PABG_11929 [Paracoccidioides brasiliensis Pb03]